MSSEPVTVLATPADVAAILRARTQDGDGRELGEWTDDTRPSLAQVEEQISMARTLTQLDAGGEFPDACREGGEAVVGLLAAMLVEQSYFPEQVDTTRSSYEQLRALYDRAREGLMRCVEEHGEDAVGGPGGAYSICTPAEPCFGGGCLPPIDWWQRNLERLPLP